MAEVSGGGAARVTAPEPLAQHHHTEQFDCGDPALDDWLKRRARHNEIEGASRTFVVCADDFVVGYYTLAAGSVHHRQTTARVRRNMPDPIPVILLGRLAVHREWQSKGLGADLLADAVLRATGAADTIGVRAILVHAASERAKSFYERHGLRPSPVDPLTLMLTIEEARKMLVPRA